MIVVIDYAVGNLAAVANMFKRLGVACEITADAEKIRRADKIILPGNGAFDACMQGLRATGLVPLLEERVLQHKTPLLGICVGAQMLGHRSEEGSEPGLGWVDMQVRRFPELPGLLVPHMGWCSVGREDKAAPILQSLDTEARFYFVHSYYMQPVRPQDVLLTAQYGIDFTAAVQVDNITGVQFHPEKSHRYGKQLLGQFAGGGR
ncbi:imidazole glycerol phosphate synthase subunit HisH [Acidovorax sp.]|uniref:imidazole glycerol phosphate synthase subunit HisH n=1 Tax=Acidovorax sp. TaxID=1872122 RepID=UPI0040378155